MTTVLDGAGERSAKACGPKTGQVLVRTRPHSDARKAQCFQSRKLAMSDTMRATAGRSTLRSGTEV
jgi:hypothetical protein